jgi:hypothetical protein
MPDGPERRSSENSVRSDPSIEDGLAKRPKLHRSDLITVCNSEKQVAPMELLSNNRRAFYRHVVPLGLPTSVVLQERLKIE